MRATEIFRSSASRVFWKKSWNQLTYVIFRHWGWHPFLATNSPGDVWHRVLYVWDAKGLVIQKILQFLLIQGGLRLRSKKCVIEFCVQNSGCEVFNSLNFSNLSIFQLKRNSKIKTVFTPHPQKIQNKIILVFFNEFDRYRRARVSVQ